jgi:hypothetical protein
MSGIKTADMRPHTLDQGQLTTDSESVEELPSLPSHLALQVPASYLYRAHFVGPETEKTGRLDTHTTAIKLALLPRDNLT